jgi:uridine kinase
MPFPRAESFVDLAQRLNRLAHPTVIAIDGRSASGKTTFAKHLANALNAPLVHTDDIAWYHSFFDWWPLAIEHILEPFRAGQAVDWRPEAWIAQNRSGSIEVPVSPIVLLEGVSAARLELMAWVDLVVWVETDLQVAEHRGLERDGPEGRDFWFEWQAAERPFLERDRPWERADVVVDGASSLKYDPKTQFIALANRLG